MDVLATLNKTYHFITMRMVETGQAPHYTEIGKTGPFWSLKKP